MNETKSVNSQAAQKQTVNDTPPKRVVMPAKGEVITSLTTNNTYTIGEPIGEGHFGKVFACTDIWNNQLAAKVLKPLGFPYPKVRASAEAEFQKLVALRHPNVTYIYDAFEFRDTFYIVTERCLCPVSALFTLDRFEGLAWLVPIARCVLQALHFLHLNNVAHQDIHPGNVFATFVKDEMKPDSTVLQFKLADLGVAKVFDDIDAKNTRNKSIVPPEVLRPDEFGPIDYRIDIYNVALLLLELAVCKPVTFTPEETLAGRPRTLAETLPPPFNFALGKALRRHVAFRTATAMDLWRDLQGAVPQSTPPTT